MKDPIAALLGVDWHFHGAATDFLTHGIHPYPAKFIPQIPAKLIETLSRPGDLVADVFCGSGTTLVEAMALGRSAVGVDANPLACLISRAKTRRITEMDALRLTELATRANSMASGVDLLAGKFRTAAWRPADDGLRFWFEAFVVEELAAVLGWIRESTSELALDLALTAFSSIVVQVSKQDSDTRYVRRAKGVKPGDTFRRFARAVERAVSAARAFTAAAPSDTHAKVILGDVLRGPDIGSIDLVVSSPPYPNAYSYHLYHRTRMLWLGMDQPTFKQQEIGSHRKYSAKSDRAASIETFEHEMKQVFAFIAEHLRPGGMACFVVGDSTIRGERFDNADVLSTAASTAGFTQVARIERELQATKKAFNPAIGKIKTEKVLVLELQG